MGFVKDTIARCDNESKELSLCPFFLGLLEKVSALPGRGADEAAAEENPIHPVERDRVGALKALASQPIPPTAPTGFEICPIVDRSQNGRDTDAENDDCQRKPTHGLALLPLAVEHPERQGYDGESDHGQLDPVSKWVKGSLYGVILERNPARPKGLGNQPD
ncbi:hypothetical protein [Mesorhizobium abyssinicae]|uniref:hypothetical protein n=1 Tax=Mesorhizobium abyssinicae TaxID=1209958 RepID=UPI002A23D64E|nr:hypothetical protein [Mesorhizobium abyssinicae]